MMGGGGEGVNGGKSVTEYIQATKTSTKKTCPIPYSFDSLRLCILSGQQPVSGSINPQPVCNGGQREDSNINLLIEWSTTFAIHKQLTQLYATCTNKDWILDLQL